MVTSHPAVSIYEEEVLTAPAGTLLPGVDTGCLVKDTLKAGSSLRGEGYIRLRMKKPAPQQNSTPIMSRTLRRNNTAEASRSARGDSLVSVFLTSFSFSLCGSEVQEKHHERKMTCVQTRFCARVRQKIQTTTHQKYQSLWMDRARRQQRVPQQSS